MWEGDITASIHEDGILENAVSGPSVQPPTDALSPVSAPEPATLVLAALAHAGPRSGGPATPRSVSVVGRSKGNASPRQASGAGVGGAAGRDARYILSRARSRRNTPPADAVKVAGSPPAASAGTVSVPDHRPCCSSHTRSLKSRAMRQAGLRLDALGVFSRLFRPFQAELARRLHLRRLPGRLGLHPAISTVAIRQLLAPPLPELVLPDVEQLEWDGMAVAARPPVPRRRREAWASGTAEQVGPPALAVSPRRPGGPPPADWDASHRSWTIPPPASSYGLQAGPCSVWCGRGLA